MVFDMLILIILTHLCCNLACIHIINNIDLMPFDVRCKAYSVVKLFVASFIFSISLLLNFVIARICKQQIKFSKIFQARPRL